MMILQATTMAGFSQEQIEAAKKTFMEAAAYHQNKDFANALAGYANALKNPALPQNFLGAAITNGSAICNVIYNDAVYAYNQKNAHGEDTVSNLSETIGHLNKLFPFVEQAKNSNLPVQSSASYYYLRGDCYRRLMYLKEENPAAEVKLDGENKTLKQLAALALKDLETLKTMFKSMSPDALSAFRAEHGLSEGWSLETALENTRKRTL